MHRDSIDRFEVHSVPSLVGRKRIGAYLLEAGLINEAQVEVALNDQQATGLKFGEVLATRGWIKQQTVEYLMKKVVVPERKGREHKTHHQYETYSQNGAVQSPPAATRAKQRRRPAEPGAKRPGTAQKRPGMTQQQPAARRPQPTRSPLAASGRPPKPNQASNANDAPKPNRRDAPITKPLPSVSNPNDDVSWVG